MYENIKRWYILGLWSTEMVYNAVAKGIITSEQAASITERK